MGAQAITSIVSALISGVLVGAVTIWNTGGALRQQEAQQRQRRDHERTVERDADASA